ncbi:MAG: 30S ribosomal protein S17 [Boseongicola sp.]|nr:30S ribosomal protein S17 [Boseongicola sp.]
MTEQTATTQIKRTVTGKVVSDKMDKSITVAIERKVKHPMYGKYVSRTTKLMAHDENNEAKAGDTVTLSECRPRSKRKAWELVTVVEQARVR